MGLVTNSKDSLYGGINQQAAEHRLPTQVEESINAYPTVNNGLLKRNPTSKLLLTDNITYDSNMYVYAYDRGLAGDEEEKYSIQITEAGGMEIIDTNTGKVFTETNGGVIYNNPEAKDYLYPFAGSNGYSAVTIKDSTFLLNKHIQPKMVDRSYNGVGVVSETKYFKTIGLKKTPNVFTLFTADLLTNKAPIQAKAYHIEYTDYTIIGGISFPVFRKFDMVIGVGSKTTINVDGYVTSLSVTVPTTLRPDGFRYPNAELAMSYSAWISNLYERLVSILPDDKYLVKIINGDDIRVTKYDGTAISVTFSIVFDAGGFTPIPSEYIVKYSETILSVQSDYYTGITSGSTTEDVSTLNTNYNKDAFIWIKSSNPSSAYTYKVTLKDTLGNIATFSTSQTTTEAAASALATAINSHANFSAVYVGSVVKATAVSADMQNIETSDTFGNLASFGWTKSIANHLELPKKLGFDDTLVFVKGDIESAFSGYWLNYKDGLWQETVSPFVETVIDSKTMPHILTREFNTTTGAIEFRLSQWADWSIRSFGDNDSNPVPSFINTNPIKDIFFFKNRLGFITQRTVVMSEVGNYGNFFRTTVATLLDSDRIDTTVDTTKAIELEYVTYLEDSLMLFSDKAQFKLEGGGILSPKSIQVSQTSAYEINKNIRPIFMNDKVFFCAKRGNYTALMQYHVYGDGRVSEAIDVTSHAEQYIPLDVTTLSGSSINNILFITCKSKPNTVYVYKYLDSGEDRVQSAWFKWTYNGEIYSAFSLGKNLNILINRYQSSVVSNWVLGSGIWNGSNLWIDDGIWIGSPADLTASDNFEIQSINPQTHQGYFIDATEMVEDTTKVENLIKTATSSALVYSCNVQMIYSSVLSLANGDLLTNYTIQADTVLGNTYISTNGDLLLPRNPADFVTSITITINDADGSIFYGVNFIYSNQTEQLLHNGLFQDGIVGWTFTNWTITYGQKDLGAVIPVRVELGEWVFKAQGVSQTRGTLKMKTCQINSEDGSDFELEIEDVNRNSIRKVKSRYTVDRKPMVYGDSKHIRLSILNNNANGFRINSVSLEGNYNSRNRRTS